MPSTITARRLIDDDVVYNQLDDSSNGAVTTSWVKVIGDIIAGVGGDATAVSGVLEIAVPDADGAVGTVIFSDANGTLVGANASLGKTVDAYTVPGPMYARWNLTTVTGGTAKPFISGRGW